MEVLRRVVTGGGLRRADATAPVRSARHRPSAKHEKLEENWESNEEPVVDGLIFYLKYLGNVIVDHPNGEGTTASAVKKIIAMSKKKLVKMEVLVSPRGIRMTEIDSNTLFEDVSIYRVSFCTNDSTHTKIFAFIARNNDNETMECHAFLCPKKKIAQAITLSVSQSFNLAFESWEREKELKKLARAQLEQTKAVGNTPGPCHSTAVSSAPVLVSPTSQVPSLPSGNRGNVPVLGAPPSKKQVAPVTTAAQPFAVSPPAFTPTTTSPTNNNPFVHSFNEDDDLDLEFESLATSRNMKLS